MTKHFNLMLGEIPALDQIPAKMKRTVMRTAVKAVAVDLRGTVPDSGKSHKGKLKKSIRYQVRKGGDEGVVFSTAPHAHLVHNGVKGGTYTARPGHVMVFQSGGDTIFTKVIHYKTQRGRPFMTETAERMKPDIVRILQDGAEAAIAEVAAGE